MQPVLVRPSFQEEVRPLDPLGLSRRVDERLREVTARGTSAGLVFWDVPEAPGAYQLSGRYRVQDGQATVRVYLFEGEKETFSFSIHGAASAPDALVEVILGEVERRLANVK